MGKTVTGGRTLRENGAGTAGDHSVGLSRGAGQGTRGKGGQWESLGGNAVRGLLSKAHGVIRGDLRLP